MEHAEQSKSDWPVQHRTNFHFYMQCQVLMTTRKRSFNNVSWSHKDKLIQFRMKSLYHLQMCSVWISLQFCGLVKSHEDALTIATLSSWQSHMAILKYKLVHWLYYGREFTLTDVYLDWRWGRIERGHHYTTVFYSSKCNQSKVGSCANLLQAQHPLTAVHSPICIPCALQKIKDN